MKRIISYFFCTIVHFDAIPLLIIVLFIWLYFGSAREDFRPNVV